MKITISRSFSAKKQVKQFEPVDAFCAAQIEYDLASPIDKERDATEMQSLSHYLDEFCRAEVDKTLAIIFAQKKDIDHGKIKDAAKDEAELDAGLDL